MSDAFAAPRPVLSRALRWRGQDAIMARERALLAQALEGWGSHAAIELYGQRSAKRLAIISFNIRHAGRFLHHNFVATLLNDLFGVQVRAGCSCAGPYAEQLLGIEYALAKEFESALLQGDELVRPGVVRLNFSCFMSDEAAKLLIAAVRFVADHGWKLLPAYTFVPASAEWRHRADKKFALRDRRWLSHLSFKDGRISYPGVRAGSTAEQQLPAQRGPGPEASSDAKPGSGPGGAVRLTEAEGEELLAHAARAVAEIEQAAKGGKGLLCAEGGDVVQGGWGATAAQLSAESKVCVDFGGCRLWVGLSVCWLWRRWLGESVVVERARVLCVLSVGRMVCLGLTRSFSAATGAGQPRSHPPALVPPSLGGARSPLAPR